MKTDGGAKSLGSANRDRAVRSRVFIVDDHPLICEALTAALNAQPDLVACGYAYDARRALPMIHECKPHAILLDISLNGESGLEFLRIFRASGNTQPVLVLSMHREDLYSDSVLRCGGQGYIMKEEGSEAVLGALRKVLDGGLYLSSKQSSRLLDSMIRPKMRVSNGIGPEALSDREREIFEHAGRGMSSVEIARKLHISPRTVETHRTHIKTKLGLRTRSEMLHAAIRWVEREGTEGPVAAAPEPAVSPRSHRPPAR